MKTLLTMLIAGIPILGQNFLRDALPLANNQANELYQEQRYEEALKSYLDLYGVDTDNGALAYNIGNTYQALGETDKATQFYKKALGSEHTEARNNADFNMGYLQLKNQNVPKAIEHYVSYLKENPHDEGAKRNLEIALRQLQQQEQQQQNQQEDQQQEQQQQDQNQDQQNSQQDQNQQSNQEQQQDPQQDQQESDQNQDQSPNSPSQQDDPSQSEQRQDEQNQPEETDPNQPQPDESQAEEQNLDDETKRQILQALQEQEADQQKQHQQRKTGRVNHRAKDW